MQENEKIDNTTKQIELILEEILILLNQKDGELDEE